MDTSKIKIRTPILIRILAVLCVICYLIPLPAMAEEEQQIIRVGYYPLENYHAVDETGNMTGYEIEYLNKISEKTGWNYTYLQADSWNHAMEMLANNEVDLISPSQIVGSRMEHFGFSSMPIGKLYSAIFTLPTDETLYEDFDKFSKMTFGIEDGVAYKELFIDYANENNFTPNIISYKTYEDLENALHDGEIDAVIANIMRADGELKILGRFGASSCYFMFRKDDLVLEEALNYALYKIDLEYPTYQDDLIYKYFPIYSTEFLTKEEIEYVNTLDEITVGCPTYLDPVSYLDEETGEIAGITKDILDMVSERSGVKFRYVELPPGEISYDYLREHNIMMVSCVENNGINANLPGLRLSIPYLNSQKVLVGKRGTTFDKNAPLTVAVSTGSQTFSKVLKAKYPNFTIVIYDHIEDCMKAVKSGEADVLMQNQYTVENYLTKPQYSQLAIIPYEGMADSLSLSLILSPDTSTNMNPVLSDRKLIKILDKGIMNITEDENSRIIISHTTGRPYQFSFTDFLYQYRYTIAILVIVFVICAQYGVFTYQIRKKSLQKLRISEKKLQNITNNINGGVVVLLPNEGFKITYANEGFLDLIQYSKQEFDNLEDSSYIMHVHKSDSLVIHNLMKKEFVKEEQISVRLRIRRKDGTYLPTRFNGTITKSNDGTVEIYCVIMDISQEVTMLKNLELEQRKHNLIVEKANEIIYEIDLNKRFVQVSESFQKQFGWVFSKTLPSSHIQDWVSTWNLYPQDIEVFQSMMNSSVDRLEDDSCTIRIMNSQGIFKWYRISHYCMQDESGKFLLIVGKITDVDEEVREKLLLEELSQLDSATGLYNKETFLQLAKQYLIQSHDTNSAMVFLDLDHFKSVNDLLGHMTGDKAILDAAKKLQIIFSSYDLLARFGGDEFCILVKDIPRQTLEKKLSWALEKLCETYYDDCQSATVTVTASIGVAFTSDLGNDITTLLEGADKALYNAKEQGRNQYCVYNN